MPRDRGGDGGPNGFRGGVVVDRPLPESRMPPRLAGPLMRFRKVGHEHRNRRPGSEGGHQGETVLRIEPAIELSIDQGDDGTIGLLHVPMKLRLVVDDVDLRILVGPTDRGSKHPGIRGAVAYAFTNGG